MSEAGPIRHEVVEEDGTGLPLLHIYLPEGLTSSDVVVTTGQSPDVAEVFIERADTEDAIGFIELSGYHLPRDESQTKYNKKRNRFTLRLVHNEKLTASAPAHAVQAVTAAATVSEAAIPRASSPSAASPVKGVGASPFLPSVPASTGNSFGLLDNDDVSDAEGGGEGAAGAAKKKKKKKKKGKKGGAAASGEGQEEEGAEAAMTANGGSSHPEGGSGSAAAAGAGSASGGEDAQPAAPADAGGEGAAGAAKKKKKKKKGGAADGAAADEECVIGEKTGGDDAEVEAEEAALPDRAPSPSPATPPGDVSPSRSASVSVLVSGPGSCNLSKYASRALSVDMAEDFAAAPFGSFEVGRAVDHDPMLGPAVHHGLGKVSVKGEDKWLEAPSNSFAWEGFEDAATPVSAFGIFDGHGGRMAAQHAAKNLLPLVGIFASRAVGPDVPLDAAALAEAGYLVSEEQGHDEAVLARAQVAAVQDALIARLPKALHAGFVQCDEDVVSRHKSSGTTATLAVQVGWELLVANVGDSLAYLDTGSEIVVISANHRVAENTDEQQRIINAGGRIKPAKYGEDDEGHPGTDTPHEGLHLRVWPGGINMTRTIGDEAAKGLLIAEPAVRQISLPVTGARLIIASDGLWDAVNAKAAIGQLRTCNAREAASKAALFAMRNKKHDDDVTVVVADFVPREADSHAPGLLKRATGPAAVAAAALAAVGMREERAAQSWRPLETPSASWRDRHRAHRQRAEAYLEQLAEAEAAEAAEAEQLERQRRMAVAPAAGTAGVGTAVRLPPVSDTYRELAELKLSVADMEAAFEPHAKNAGGDPTEAEGGGDEWTQVVDTKKKKDASGFDLRRELTKAARPAEAIRAAGGSGRGSLRERPRGREWPPRREREGENGGPIAVVGDVGKESREDAVEQAQTAQAAGPQRPPRRDRRDRGDRGDRGGRGGGGPGGGAAATVAAAGAAEAKAVGAAAAPAAAATASTTTTPPGVVKAAAGDYLFVPKSLLTGGHAAAVVPPSASAAVEGDAGGSKPRRERPPRRPRREGPPPAGAAAGQTAEGAADGPDQDATAAAGASPEVAPAAASTSRRTQPRRKREKEAAAAAVASAIGGLPAAAVAPPSHVMPATSSSDPVVELAATPGHHHRQQQPPQHHQHQYAGQPAQTHGSQQPAHEPRQQHHPSQGGGRTAAPSRAAAGSHYLQQQQQHPRPYVQQHQHEAPQQQHNSRPTAPAAPVPTYAGPMDFGAGFGPGSGMWQPPSGDQYGAFPAAPAAAMAPNRSGGGAAAAGTTVNLPQRPPGLAPAGSIQGPRNPQDVAAAAAAAAASAVARKGAAGRGGGAPGAGRGYAGGQQRGGRR